MLLAHELLGQDNATLTYLFEPLRQAYLIGNYKQALQYGEESLRTIADSLGTDDEAYPAMLNAVGVIYDEIGNYEQAQTLLNKAISHQKKLQRRQPRNTRQLCHLPRQFSHCLPKQRRLQPSRTTLPRKPQYPKEVAIQKTPRLRSSPQ